MENQTNFRARLDKVPYHVMERAVEECNFDKADGDLDLAEEEKLLKKCNAILAENPAKGEP